MCLKQLVLIKCLVTNVPQYAESEIAIAQNLFSSLMNYVGVIQNLCVLLCRILLSELYVMLFLPSYLILLVLVRKSRVNLV